MTDQTPTTTEARLRETLKAWLAEHPNENDTEPDLIEAAQNWLDAIPEGAVLVTEGELAVEYERGFTAGVIRGRDLEREGAP
jgi:hypothetical protein